MFQAMFRVLHRYGVPACFLLSAAPAGALELVVPELRWVLLAPPGRGPVQVIEVGRAVRPLASLYRGGRGAVLALAVEPKVRRVWVLADDGLDVHAAAGGRLLGHWSLPQAACAGRLELRGDATPRVWCGSRGFDAIDGLAALMPVRVQ